MDFTNESAFLNYFIGKQPKFLRQFFGKFIRYI
jgi:hypothetical protein